MPSLNGRKGHYSGGWQSQLSDPWKSDGLSFKRCGPGVAIFDLRHRLSALFLPGDMGYDRARRELFERERR